MYAYKDKSYRVHSSAEMKHPESGKWIKCVVYHSIENGKMYVREEKDFKAKFKPVGVEAYEPRGTAKRAR